MVRGALVAEVERLHGALARVDAVVLGVAVVEAALAVEVLAAGDHVHGLGIIALGHAGGVDL